MSSNPRLHQLVVSEELIPPGSPSTNNSQASPHKGFFCYQSPPSCPNVECMFAKMLTSPVALLKKECVSLILLTKRGLGAQAFSNSLDLSSGFVT